MDYRIEIKDMENLQDPLILEYAERSSITLNWMGGDDKTQPIVGSELNFSMEVLDGADGKYIQYFTSDEQKWQVTKYLSNTDTIIWRGYILPESYSEPWANPTFYPQFSAVDGLGLLKGKKLTDDFYSEEKTVIEIISACLKLTGIDFDIYLSPAITNAVQEHWHEIYLDTRNYFKEDKPPSAYVLLEEIISSMRCQLFQAEGRWYIEGINKRHLPKVTFYKYNISGVYLGTVDIEKQIKKVGWYPTPMLNMIPAIKDVNITHERDELGVTEDLYQEQDIDWIDALGVVREIYPQNWDFTQDYKPIMRAPGYYLELPVDPNTTVQFTKYVAQRERPYVLRGTRVKVEMEFKLILSRALTEDEINTHLENGKWINAPMHGMFLNDTRIYFNGIYSEPAIEFGKDLTATTEYEFRATEDGFLKIQFHPTPGGSYLYPDLAAVQVRKITLKDLDQKDKEFYSQTITPNSTQIRDIDLAISDDISAISKCFYLEKQRELDPHKSFKVEVPIENYFQHNGHFYAVVSLKHANLIEQYINTVHWTNPYEYLQNLEVIYNLNGGEQMVVKSDQELSGNLYVVVSPYKDQAGDRQDWIRWADALYNIEKKPYTQAVAEIEHKLFSEPHLRIEASAAAPVKFNDLIQFDYRGTKKYFVPTNASWNPDENESQVSLVEGIYAGNSLGNIPPYVNAGPDIFIASAETEVQIAEAQANDPNGYIESLVWTQTEGTGATFSSASSLNPLISNITGDKNAFTLTATDNDGTSAVDSMRVERWKNYDLTLTLLDHQVVSDGPIRQRKEVKEFQLGFNPDLPGPESATLTFDAELLLGANDLQNTNIDRAKITILKSGVELFSKEISSDVDGANSELTADSSFNFIQGDDTRIFLEVQITEGDPATSGHVASSKINFSNATFQENTSTANNLPVSETLKVTKYLAEQI